MRLHHIEIKNFRGIKEAQVDLNIHGITIIEGPNEIGKSSIAEAIDLIFEFNDSSRHSKILAIKPVNFDVGTEVTIVFETGPYLAKYHKRWNRHPETVLVIESPKYESLTGRIAHDRMNEILDATLDKALWKALRYQQGFAISQASLSESQTLVTALDQIAAQSVNSMRDDGGIWKKVEQEWLRFFTPTGKTTSARVAQLNELNIRKERETELRSALKTLDELADLHRTKVEELTVRKKYQSELTSDIENTQRLKYEIDAKQHELSRLSHQKSEAEAVFKLIDDQYSFRIELLNEVGVLSAELEELSNYNDQTFLLFQAAEKDVENAESQRSATRQARDLAKANNDEAELIHEYSKSVLDKNLLGERLDRANGASRKITEANNIIASSKIDDDLFFEIEAAHAEFLFARAKASIESATLSIAAHSDLDISKNGSKRHLSAHEIIEEPVTDALEIEIGDIAKITVFLGSTARENEAVSNIARSKLQKAYELADILDSPSAFEEAKRLIKARERALEDLTRARNALKDDLRDLTILELQAKVERAIKISSEFEGSPKFKPSIDYSFDATKLSLQHSKLELERANLALDESQTNFDIISRRLWALKSEMTARSTTLTSKREQYQSKLSKLESDRRNAPDEELNEALLDAKKEFEERSLALSKITTALAMLNPDAVESQLNNLFFQKTRLDTDVSAIEGKIRDIKIEIAIRGEDDPQGSLDVEITLRMRLERDFLQIEQQADTIDMLKRRLGFYRDQAQRAYIGPFKDAVEGLARIVFGPSLSLELDHTTFEIISRTLENVTVPFDSLSGGAKEQLSLLARIAVAKLVDRKTDDGISLGVPIIIDDALGYSDPNRLVSIGAAISTSNVPSQIIILTCQPTRYLKVGRATTVSLP